MNIGFREAQVVVAGGGVAGFCAALAAARNGADTLMVERYGFLGGMFTGGNMTVLNCPAAGGIGNEIVDQLMKDGYARMCPDDPPNYPIFHYTNEYSTMNVLYDAEMAKILLLKMAKEAGVRLLLHSFVTGAVVGEGAVKGIIVENKSGRQILQGGVTVDATSDGDVAASAGASFRKGQTEKGILFAMTMLVRLSNVDWKAVSEYSRNDPGLRETIKMAIDRGDLPYYKPRTREMVNYWGHAEPELSHLLYEDEAMLWGGTVENVDGTNVDDLTRAEIEAREQFMSELDFLRKYVPGFKNARIQSSGVSVGVRDTRHIVGLSTLTGQDILARRKFPDAVAYNVKGGYPVNDLPYGCFVPEKVDGLLVAGNCLSIIPGSTKMGLELGSYNNLKDIPTMWTTGEAAGTAAALCVRSNVEPRNLNVKALQEQLFKQGALLDQEAIKKRQGVKLPSGKTVEEFYNDLIKEQTKYWRSRGEYKG